MSTTWKYVRGYEGLYQISDDGKVKSFKKDSSGKLMKNRLTRKGYHDISFMKDRKAKRFFVHVLVASHFQTKPADKTQVNHKDGIKTNNNNSNLEWVTGAENQLHAYRTGLFTLRGIALIAYNRKHNNTAA